MRAVSGQPVRPFAEIRVDAGNDIRIDIRSLDFDEALEAPASMRYRIDDLTNRVNVLAWTSIGSPATETSVTVSAAVNAMSNNACDRQLNQLTVEATYADGTKCKDTVCYELCRVYEI